jgi:hypothetical protein
MPICAKSNHVERTSPCLMTAAWNRDNAQFVILACRIMCHRPQMHAWISILLPLFLRQFCWPFFFTMCRKACFSEVLSSNMEVASDRYVQWRHQRPESASQALVAGSSPFSYIRVRMGRTKGERIEKRKRQVCVHSPKMFMSSSGVKSPNGKEPQGETKWARHHPLLRLLRRDRHRQQHSP